MLQMTWLRVHLYADLLRQQVEAAQADRGDGGSGGSDGTAGGARSVGAGAGVVGQTFAASPNIGVYATGEAVRGLALFEAQERDRVVRFAKTAHDMGIAEQQIRLAEQTGQMFATVINEIVRALDRDPADPRVQGIVHGVITRHVGAGGVIIEGQGA